FYLYVQNGVQASDSAITRAAQHFEKHIYPTDRKYFGTEWRPGVDNDVHITCLIGDLRSTGVGGYYSAEDEYPRAVNPYSNQREMFYINSGQGTIPGDSYFDVTLAHEFQHMIHWNMHPHENLWLNEGMSMLAEKLNGYASVDEPDSFALQPDTQLDTFNATASGSVAHYGAAYLFLDYLYERYGQKIVHEILVDRKYTDMELIDDVLKRLHIHTSARTLFKNWVVANAVNDPTLGKGIYAYKALPRKVAIQKTVSSLPFSWTSSVSPWAAQYAEMDGIQSAKPFHLQFSGVATVPAVGVKSNGPFWWTNRGDMSDTRLQRTVDLRHVHHATLHFQAWYDIEKDYDYAYVEASSDAGKTWRTLPGTSTTTSNPNGANYGYGYTGESKSWLNQTVDLSPYAGHRIQLRFEYITDEGYNGNGMVFRKLSIPEIGYQDNWTGWHAAGFVPVAVNSLPTDWTVQVIGYTAHGETVSTMPLKGDKGSILIDPVKSGFKKLVVAVFTTSPKTRETASYQLSTG
ncbi:MAG TPA: hypothetical protein VF898_09620, partial [Chloroflexota bacterium]